MNVQTIDNQPKRKQGKSQSAEITLPGNRVGWIRKRGDHWQADLGTINGTRVIKVNRLWNKDDAVNWARSTALQLAEQGFQALNLKDEQRLDAIKAIEELSGTGATLLQAAKYFRRFKASDMKQMKVSEVAESYMADCEERDLRPRSLEDIKYRLAKFSEKFGDRLMSEIRRQDADGWIKSLSLSNLSKKHYKTIVHGLFSYAIDKEYCIENPFAGKRRQKIRQDETMPEFVSWLDVEKILRAAEEHEQSMVAPLAIGFFCGLRTTEIRKIDWSNVNLETMFLTVTPQMAKKRSVRQVSIPENLATWLAPYKKDSGLIAPEGRTSWRLRSESVRAKAKVKWPFNGMRHSFITYRVPLVSNINEVALEAGNSPDMIYKHYRGLATKQDAEKYFQLRPRQENNTV